MTKQEAQAVDVLLDWIFGPVTQRSFEPRRLRDACTTLAEAAHKQGAQWDGAKVAGQRW